MAACVWRLRLATAAVRFGEAREAMDLASRKAVGVDPPAKGNPIYIEELGSRMRDSTKYFTRQPNLVYLFGPGLRDRS